MAQGENGYSYNAILEWLNPATQNAHSIASDANRFACELRSTERSARNELLGLPDCPYRVDSKRKNFLDSMDDAKSSGDELKRRCDELCREWNEFYDVYEKSNKEKKQFSSVELDKLLEDMNKLLKKCAACGQLYSETQEKLNTAINDCSHLVDELSKEADRKRKEECDRKLKGYGAAVVGLGAAVATAGVATAPAMFAAGSLTTASVGTAAWTKVTSDALGRLSDRFSEARGSMSATLRRLNELSNLIASLERSTKDMAKNIDIGRSREQRVRDTINSKDEQIEKLKEQLRKAGISLND
ncbi:hypothetical protein BOX15_Mlig013564g1 [Macrostomum lignano]|uniref:Uncharacterized protein n=1 Tax=Macrostomum lignano TaxID=282301 RepID=A0A267G4N0_9PLAT|nr:hypothetical protein BOX15_Mlig013564g1 [Macrostomum lignano]